VNDRVVADEVWSIAIDPRLPGRVYLGVSPALLYRSDDGGESWTACDSVKRIPGYETWTFPPPPHIAHVRSIAIDPNMLGGVYIGVEEGGVYHSPNGGETWESLNEGLYWDVHTVRPGVSDNDLFATTGAGFHKSSDRGRSWSHVTNGIDRRYTVPLLVSRAIPGVLYTAAAGGPPPSWAQGVNAAIYRSDDRGENWQRLKDGLPERFDVMVNSLEEDDEGRIYAAAGGEIYMSKDRGNSWKSIASELIGVRSLVYA
jgi:photosystem II stability/assembly factor-like uncharacterized protein